MKIYPEIPRALEVLKEKSGPNWPRLKEIYISFLNTKREIEKSGLPTGLKNHLLRLEYNSLVVKFEEGGWKYGAMSINDLCSHGANVLTTLRRRPYSSRLMCFVQDSWNTTPKSGNKKYPYLTKP